MYKKYFLCFRKIWSKLVNVVKCDIYGGFFLDNKESIG